MMRRVRSWFTVYILVLCMLFVTAGPAFAQYVCDLAGGYAQGELSSGYGCYDCPLGEGQWCDCYFWLVTQPCWNAYGPVMCHVHWQVASRYFPEIGSCLWEQECMWGNWHCYQ